MLYPVLIQTNKYSNSNNPVSNLDTTIKVEFQGMFNNHWLALRVSNPYQINHNSYAVLADSIRTTMLSLKPYTLITILNEFEPGIILVAKPSLMNKFRTYLANRKRYVTKLKVQKEEEQRYKLWVTRIKGKKNKGITQT